jgi:hypothetical protein
MPPYYNYIGAAGERVRERKAGKCHLAFYNASNVSSHVCILAISPFLWMMIKTSEDVLCRKLKLEMVKDVGILWEKCVTVGLCVGVVYILKRCRYICMRDCLYIMRISLILEQGFFWRGSSISKY